MRRLVPPGAAAGGSELRANATTELHYSVAGLVIPRLWHDGSVANAVDAAAVDAVRVLAQHGKVAPVTLHNRIDFATSMVDGRTAGELAAKSRSAVEVAELWIYVNKQIRRRAQA